MERASSVPDRDQSSRPRRRTVRCCTCNTRQKRRETHELPGGVACNDLRGCLERLRASTEVTAACARCGTRYTHELASGQRLVTGVGLCLPCLGAAYVLAGVDPWRDEDSQAATVLLRQLARAFEAGAMPLGSELLFFARRLGLCIRSQDRLQQRADRYARERGAVGEVSR